MDQAGLATARTVNAAVMVEIMLAIMLLGIDTITLRVLRHMQTGPLALGDDTIGLGTIFHVVHALLTVFQTIGFALGQAAGSHTLVDALLLVGLALVDTRRIGLAKARTGRAMATATTALMLFMTFSSNGGSIP